MSTYIYSNSRVLRYERKLKQAEKAGKHNKAKKYAEKLERLRAEAAEQETESDSDSDDDDIDSDDEADNSFALDEEPDVAPRGLKGASKLERLARAAGEHDSVRRLPGTTEGSLRDLELRAAILGYGPNSGDDSGRVVVQPRAIATRTRSL